MPVGYLPIGILLLQLTKKLSDVLKDIGYWVLQISIVPKTDKADRLLSKTTIFREMYATCTESYTF